LGSVDVVLEVNVIANDGRRWFFALFFGFVVIVCAEFTPKVCIALYPVLYNEE
jgi:hypothetical protein